MKARSAGWLALVVVLLFLDQASKQWAVEHLQGHPPQTYGLLTLTFTQNRGSWGSLGANWASPTRWILLALAPGLVLLYFLVNVLRNPQASGRETLGYLLVLAGGSGNLLDRFRLGYVRDFLYLGNESIGTNIFNLADAVLMVGIGLILWSQARTSQAPEDSELHQV